MKTVRWILIASFCLGFAGIVRAADVVYLVRHAEKTADGTSNPELTDEGRARACYLARFFADKGLTHVLSTDYRRTLQTAAPVAELLGLEVEEYDPKHLAVLAMMLKNKSGTYLIVGHSNTVPELIRLLSGEDIGKWDEKEYEQFYEIRFEGSAIITHRHDSAAHCPELAN